MSVENKPAATDAAVAAQPKLGPAPGKPFRVQHLAQYKAAGVPLTMLTAYDYLTASIFDQAGIDLLLVGDSYGTTQLGFSSTTQVTMEDMVRATGAVARGAQRALVVADLSFGAYEASPAQAVENAVALVRAGAAAVKLEGGRRVLEQVQAIVRAGINVVGHLGFTPQSENALGGKRIQGRGQALQELIADAQALEAAGVCAIVFEMIPDAAMGALHECLQVPQIGIGAGPQCDGQVLVWSDMAGMQAWAPSFSKVFGQVGQALREAAEAYRAQVLGGTFPAPEHYHLQ